MNATANAIFVQAAAPDEPITGPSLRPGDQENLDQLEEQWNPFKKLIHGMKIGLQRGIYLSGPAGIGKTYFTTTTLNDLQADYRHHTTRLSIPGLFTARSFRCL